MSVSSEFKSVVASGDLITVRTFLKNYLIGEKDYSLFDESLDFASKSLPVLQEHDGTVFEEREELWTKDYLNRLLVKVVSNFSRERITHIKKVANKVLPAVESNISTPSGTVLYQERTNQKTGRTVIAETEVREGRTETTAKQAIGAQPMQGKTGRRVISETINSTPSTKSSFRGSPKRAEAIIGPSLIAGGVAVAAVGIAVNEPLVIGAGVLIVGTGAAIIVHNKRG